MSQNYFELVFHPSTLIVHSFLISSFSLYFTTALIVTLIFVLLFVAALSRHKKAGVGELELVGQMARVEKTLEPEGAVLVGGELWRARAGAGETIEHGVSVRIVGVRGHLLEVEGLKRAEVAGLARRPKTEREGGHS